MRKFAETTRKKYQRICCPECGCSSKVVREVVKGVQHRICKNGHKFVYNYHLEYGEQKRYNWNVKLNS